MQDSLQGILAINKKNGITSYDVIRDVKRVFRENNIKTKIGHSGTLDPFAEGMLIVLLGKCTRFSDYFMDMRKTYKGEFIEGFGTDTLDKDGKIIEECEHILPAVLEENTNHFTGKLMQVPPYYSALKHNGKKLYEYAREGINIKKPAREISVYSLKVENIKDYKYSFSAEVSQGTYVRKLLYDYAKLFNGTCYMTKLVRENIGEFSIYSNKCINEITYENIMLNLISPDEVSWPYDSIELKDDTVQKLRNGIRINTDLKDRETVILRANGKIFAFGEIKDKQIRTKFFI